MVIFRPAVERLLYLGRRTHEPPARQAKLHVCTGGRLIPAVASAQEPLLWMVADGSLVPEDRDREHRGEHGAQQSEREIAERVAIGRHQLG
jgi:hypothetical protein